MARKLSKWCSGCKCSTCRWQGTDNCLQDRDKPCNSCLGIKAAVPVHIPIAYGCKVDRENPVEVWTWTDGILDAIIRRNLKPKLIEAGRNQFTGEKMKKT